MIALLLMACEGQIVGSPVKPNSVDPSGSPRVCATRGQGSAPKMRLLWRTAYLGELKTHLGSGAATAAESVGLSPATDKQFAFETAGSLQTDASLESLATTADAVAVWSLSSDAIATSVFGCNARTVSGADAEACFSRFVTTTGEQLLRRHVGDAELADTLAFFRSQALLGLSDGAQEGFRQGLASLLLHPDFLYLRDAPEGSSSHLDAYSLASRVSFALTGQGPDDQLFAAARDGSLLRAEVLDGEVSRLLQTPDAKLRVRAFYRQWLRYDGLSVAYSPAFLNGIDPATVGTDAIADVDGFVSELTWNEKAAPSALLTSRATAPLTATLAQLYGSTEGATTLPESRAGLLTRVGLLASGTDDWHVVSRGLMVAQRMLCKDIAPPAFNVADAAQKAAALKVSNADRIASVTSAAACAGCHSTINPLGSARSDFDALGRAVTIEKHFAGGAFDFEVPVVSKADLSVPLGHPASVDGSVGMSNLLAATPEFEQCFTTQLVRAAMGRADDSDECLSFDSAEAVAQGGSIIDAMGATFRSPDFQLWKE